MGLENRVMLTFSKVSHAALAIRWHQIVFPWPAECEHAREHLRTALTYPLTMLCARLYSLLISLPPHCTHAVFLEP